ncbi:MAG: hypothetical protein KGL39_17115 [Patescibacteria group bacterium]|nr:hypothetical protein [Patescibacteria group bacterium]
MALELNLNLARNSLWEAINNWEETTGVFNTSYYFNEPVDQIDINGPSPSDFPAIMILRPSLTPTWFAQNMAEYADLYVITLWTEDWAYPEIEDLIEKVSNAVYRATPAGSTVTYVKQQTGLYPQLNGPITFNFVHTGSDQKTKATRADMNIALRLHKDPFAA